MVVSVGWRGIPSSGLVVDALNLDERGGGVGGVTRALVAQVTSPIAYPSASSPALSRSPSASVQRDRFTVCRDRFVRSILRLEFEGGMKNSLDVDCDGMLAF